MSVKKCIIPIAGKGTRFLPVTKSVSKEMLPIVNEPTILLQVKECFKSGIEQIIFVVGKHNYELVKSFFSENPELDAFLNGDPKKELLHDIDEIIANMEFKYVFQDENVRGTAGALYAARDLIDKDEYFGVIFGDDLYDYETPILKQLIDEHEKYNCNICGVGKVSEKQIPSYGIIRYKKDNLVDYIVEKPLVKDAPSDEAILGRYILHSTMFDKVLECEKKKNNEYLINDVLYKMNEDLRSLLVDGTYYDIGSNLGYLKANIAFGLKKDNIRDELKEFLKVNGDK